MKPNEVTSVYGPVHSWRVGMSLGIDLICETSVCSFNCVYCQLGSIQIITHQRKLFISTESVIQDFQKSDWKSSDIITYSGSGEPTLAVNLGEVAEELSKITSIPQLVLTNGTLLNNPAVIADLQKIDRVYVKLDAATNEMFMRVNRPVDGISLQTIIENVQTFKTNYQGFLGIQIMVMPMNRNEIHQLSSILNDLQPNEVQLNTPTRPYPNYWHIASRGGHAKELRPYEAVPLRTIKKEEAREFETILKQETGLNIISVYQKSSF